MPDGAESSASSATKAPKRKSAQDDKAFMQNVQHEEVKRHKVALLAKQLLGVHALCSLIAKVSRRANRLQANGGSI